MCILFQGLEIQYTLQNTTEKIIYTVANNKTCKLTWISFKIASPGADTCVDLWRLKNPSNNLAIWTYQISVLASSYVACQWLV